jgi:hypothetical protein
MYVKVHAATVETIQIGKYPSCNTGKAEELSREN